MNKPTTAKLSNTDVWHFVCDERNRFWIWKRVSADGQELAVSAYTFASFNVCVLDAERAGYSDGRSIGRLRDYLPDGSVPHDNVPERRRRVRKATSSTD
jgi:hypothetical protein